MVLLLVILNLKGQSPQDQKNMLYQKLQVGQLTVLWYAGRSSKQQRLLVLLFCHPKPEKSRALEIKKPCCIKHRSWVRAVLTVFWYAGRVLNNGVASCHPKPERTEPSRSKNHVVSTVAIGAERFDSVVVCWQKFETATSAGVAFCHPKPEGTEPSRSKSTCCINSCSWGRAFLTVFWYAR